VVHYPHIDAHHIDVIPQVISQPLVAPAPIYGSPVYRHKRAAELAYRGQLL